MNLKIVEENARTLAAAIGYSSQEAAELLDVTVALTYRENDLISGKLAGFLFNGNKGKDILGLVSYGNIHGRSLC